MNDPIRYGIIGTGMMGGEHILNIANIAGADVIALSDPTPASLDWGPRVSATKSTPMTTTVT